jgi:ACS family pantothenate transporter-like MFS transporter
MSWANEICGADAEERALVLGIMNASGYAFNAWLPVLTYPVKDAPRFRKGFIFSTVAFVAQFAITYVVWWLQRWDDRKKAIKIREEGESENEVEGAGDINPPLV